MKEIQDIKEILQVVFSWPVAAFFMVLMLRQPIIKLVDRLVNSESGKVKVGPFEAELGKLAQEGQQAVSKLNEINNLMAESRLLGLEFTEANLAPRFSQEQRERMLNHIAKLRQLTRHNQDTTCQ